MAVRYLLKDDKLKTYHQFDDDGLRSYLLSAINADKVSDKAKGAIFVDSLDGFIITYDVYTGVVRLNLTNSTPSITHFFPAEAFYLHLEPIVLAIRCLSKIELLRRLVSLNDPKIVEVVREKKILDPATGKINHSVPEKQLDNVINHIYYLVTPPKKRQPKMLAWLVLTWSVGDNKAEKPSEVHDAIYEAFLNYERRKKILHLSSMNDVQAIMNGIDNILAKNKMKLIR